MHPTDQTALAQPPSCYPENRFAKLRCLPWRHITKLVAAIFLNVQAEHLALVSPLCPRSRPEAVGALAIGTDGTIYVGGDETDSRGTPSPSKLYALNPDGS